MKFGVREICDVVLKAKANQKIGDKIFYKNEPVIYFDTLKTSSMEGAATTVYAQGGRGNSRLVAWEGERTVTFTMEDALISPAGFMILSGAGLINATTNNTIKVHATEQLVAKINKDTSSGEVTSVEVTLSEKPYEDATTNENYIYVMLLDNGEVVTEPYIPSVDANDKKKIKIEKEAKSGSINNLAPFAKVQGECVVLVDYYVEKSSSAQQIDITPDKFGGNYYLEASTLFRATNGVDMAAEFIIPNCKIQSNFTFTMASSGDPSTFTFTMDAFPDYTRFNPTKKVLAAIQIISDEIGDTEIVRTETESKDEVDNDGNFTKTFVKEEEPKICETCKKPIAECTCEKEPDGTDPENGDGTDPENGESVG